MNCPFCGKELEKEMAGDIETGRLVCCTPNCPIIDQNLFPDVWLLLIKYKKAMDALEDIVYFFDEVCQKDEMYFYDLIENNINIYREICYDGDEVGDIKL